MGRPRKPKRSKAKIKFKTKTYIGNPGKRAQMQVDSLKKAAADTTKAQSDTVKIHIKLK